MTIKRLDEMSRAERTALRVRILAAQIREATNIAHEILRQSQCWPDRNALGANRHAGQSDGCPDDGSSCLCPCHDPEE